MAGIRNAALDGILYAAHGRVRAEKAPDADPEFCSQSCAEPQLCTAGGYKGCWATRCLEKSARSRAVVGAPGRRAVNPVNPVAIYLERTTRKKGA